LRSQDLQKRLRQLRRKGKSLQEASDDKRASAAKTLEKYAKIACREFCDNVYNSFPREVRDMIYGHLDSREIAHVDQGSSSWGGLGYFDSASAAQWDAGGWREAPDHWWDVECVGEHMRRELGERYYRSVRFDFGQNFDLLSRFRVTDQWKLGFVPAVIGTNISVTIDCENYDFDGLEAPNVNTGDWDTPPGNRPRYKFLSRLEPLFGFKQGTKLSIKFSVGRCKKGDTLERQQWLCDTVLPFAFPSIHRLQGAGYNICVVLSRAACWDIDDSFVANYEFPISRSLTYEACKSQFEAVSFLSLMIMSVTQLTLTVQGQ